MTNKNSKTGLYLGIFAAVTAVAVGAILIFRGKKTSTPTRGGANTPIRTGGNLPPSSTPPIKTQQGGTDPVKSIVGGILDALGLGGGKGSGKGGGGGISFGGGSGGGTKPTQSGGSSQSSTAWNSPINYDAVLGGYVDPKTGETYDKSGKYLGYVGDGKEFYEWDSTINAHVGSDGTLTDIDGYEIGYIGSDGEVHFTETLSDGRVVDIDTGDMWDANGNYLGFTDESGDFLSYNQQTGEYQDQYGGVYNGNGEILGFEDAFGQFIVAGSDEWNSYFKSDETYAMDTPPDSYFFASGANTNTNLSELFVSKKGKIFKTKIRKKNSNE